MKLGSQEVLESFLDRYTLCREIVEDPKLASVMERFDLDTSRMGVVGSCDEVIELTGRTFVQRHSSAEARDLLLGLNRPGAVINSQMA